MFENLTSKNQVRKNGQFTRFREIQSRKRVILPFLLCKHCSVFKQNYMPKHTPKCFNRKGYYEIILLSPMILSHQTGNSYANAVKASIFLSFDTLFHSTYLTRLKSSSLVAWIYSSTLSTATNWNPYKALAHRILIHFVSVREKENISLLWLIIIFTCHTKTKTNKREELIFLFSLYII